ncbi:hypothetical protein J6590_079801 [Homalodisca vitripennis]|nr:hypothetical protein J6590_079801 [Homalodisca vitripennis]
MCFKSWTRLLSGAPDFPHLTLQKNSYRKEDEQNRQRRNNFFNFSVGFQTGTQCDSPQLALKVTKDEQQNTFRHLKHCIRCYAPLLDFDQIHRRFFIHNGMYLRLQGKWVLAKLVLDLMRWISPPPVPSTCQLLPSYGSTLQTETHADIVKVSLTRSKNVVNAAISIVEERAPVGVAGAQITTAVTLPTLQEPQNAVQQRSSNF